MSGNLPTLRRFQIQQKEKRKKKKIVSFKRSHPGSNRGYQKTFEHRVKIWSDNHYTMQPN